jgi:hypothetical protein
VPTEPVPLLRPWAASIPRSSKRYRVVMKFQATVVLEFNAPDVAEAGTRLNALLEHAHEHDLETKSLELSTPAGTPVTLPVTRT